MKKLLLLLLLTACSTQENKNTDNSTVTFLQSVANKSLYDPADGEKTGDFSSTGQILTSEVDAWTFTSSPSNKRGVYSRQEGGMKYFVAFEYNGENSKYWQTEDFTDLPRDIEIK